ncbi:MAG: hypothetical protein DRJ52_04320 [Thermoprotei archaeon]|nr:MAG: hypothetical protein DRJ52_04320 [Thermoprotei archaeon]RLE99179.1 MAG: hypothetical protein DRJ63_06120 [Thermoprotei archaeon]HDI74632.1 hypothetical protein [Thermoprotei archaeon]
MSEPQKRPISVRGIDRSLYDEALKLAHQTGRTIGEVINEALKLLIAFYEGVSETVSLEDKYKPPNVTEITGIDELTVSKEDLESENRPVLFKNIKRLRFSENVPQDTFSSKVYLIVVCDEVVIPHTLSKLEVAKKCRFVKKLRYEDED